MNILGKFSCAKCHFERQRGISRRLLCSPCLISVPEASTVRSLAALRMTERELQTHQIDQKLAPEINHAAPRVFDLPCRGLFEHAFVNVMLDLIAEILLHLGLNLIFIERIDFSGIDAVSAKKLPMTLIKLPERSVRPLAIDLE